MALINESDLSTAGILAWRAQGRAKSGTGRVHSLPLPSQTQLSTGPKGGEAESKARRSPVQLGTSVREAGCWGSAF